jgi:hypothetical protein
MQLPGNAFSGVGRLAVLPDCKEPGIGGPDSQGRAATRFMGQDGVKETLNSQTVNMEAVAEVKAVVVNNTADYARVGYFDTITKSGTNDFHFDGSYYNRNSALGARNFFEAEKTHVNYHTFNLSFAGPIIKQVLPPCHMECGVFLSSFHLSVPTRDAGGLSSTSALSIDNLPFTATRFGLEIAVTQGDPDLLLPLESAARTFVDVTSAGRPTFTPILRTFSFASTIAIGRTPSGRFRPTTQAFCRAITPRRLDRLRHSYSWNHRQPCFRDPSQFIPLRQLGRENDGRWKVQPASVRTRCNSGATGASTGDISSYGGSQYLTSVGTLISSREGITCRN